MRIFENRVRRKILGPKMTDVNVEWRRLYNEDVNDVWHVWGRGEMHTGFRW